jgi:GT2 family glycosyltransferase/glycosyltransferase involved in cell wall biosynthesis
MFKRRLSKLKHAGAKFHLGHAIARQAYKKHESGDGEGALALYKIATRMALVEGWPFVKMADLIDNPDRKLKLYKKAIRIDNHSWAYTGTIRILLSRDQLAAAESVFNDLKRTLPTTCWKNCSVTRQEVDRIEKQLISHRNFAHFSKDLNADPEKLAKKIFSKEEKNILFFSPEAPNYDQSSGGNRLYEILKILQTNLGYQVYFFTHNLIDKKYEKALKKLGINVFCSRSLMEQLKHLKLNGVQFTHAFFARWDMGEAYISQVSSLFPDIIILVDSVDIHWVREERGGVSTLEKKNREKQVYLSSDVVFVVTEEDKGHLLKEVGNRVNIKILSNIHRETNHKFTRGKDVVFVGGFGHHPNIQAAIDSQRIFKKFIREYPTDAKLYIVGHNPPKEVLKLHDGKRVIVTGYVPNIQSYLNKSRVMMAPLTWGAGIKGKLCQAIAHKVPVITTEIGNEGIGLQNMKDGWLAKSDDEFVTALKTVYSLSDSYLDEVTKNAFKKVNALTSVDHAESVLAQTLQARPVVISILTYNKAKLVESCVRSVIQNTVYPNYKIVVTINGCQDNTEKVIKKLMREYPGVDLTYIKNKKNQFFIQPNNRILKQYKDCDIVLLNNDVEIKTKCWLTQLNLAAYSAGYIACAGGKILDRDGRIAEAGSYLTSDGFGGNQGMGASASNPQFNRPYYSGYVSGCDLYMRRDAIDKVGLLDELYHPMYFEEADWQYRAHLKGLKSIYTPKCVVMHIGSATAKSDAKKYIEVNRVKFKERFKNSNIERFN